MYLAALGLGCSSTCQLSVDQQDPVPWPVMESGPPALGVKSLNHWTPREALDMRSCWWFFKGKDTDIHLSVILSHFSGQASWAGSSLQSSRVATRSSEEWFRPHTCRASFSKLTAGSHTRRSVWYSHVKHSHISAWPVRIYTSYLSPTVSKSRRFPGCPTHAAFGPSLTARRTGKQPHRDMGSSNGHHRESLCC